LVIVLSYFGNQKRIGGFSTFFLSLVFTPVVGLIGVLLSKPNMRIIRHQKQYKCSRCHLRYTEELTYCPACEKEGVKVRLKTYTMDYI
jgi:Zn finger protein HypA/HybF involved in hydrogenase expression